MAAIAIYAADAARRQRLAVDAAEAARGSSVVAADSLAALLRLIDESGAEAVIAAPSPGDWDQVDWAALSRRASLLVMVDDPARMIEALQAGAAAVLTGSADGADIAAALAAAARGLKLLPEDALGLLLPERATTSGEGEAGVLTARELDVLAALADGASNKAIARRLGISFHTVKFHVASILAKLDAESRTEAVTQAARLGLVML
jgi:DNA-binding NarL/FixJ family response regulator